MAAVRRPLVDPDVFFFFAFVLFRSATRSRLFFESLVVALRHAAAPIPSPTLSGPQIGLLPARHRICRVCPAPRFFVSSLFFLPSFTFAFAGCPVLASPSCGRVYSDFVFSRRSAFSPPRDLTRSSRFSFPTA